jgi:DNA-binding LacI/PurR family transcriptional regulator
MRDIAARAGVSAATVSYVLNAKPGMRISGATRRRILDVAEELHYRPNAIARAMARGHSHTVGVYQPHAPGAPMSGLWANEVLRGIGETLHAQGYHLLLYGYREDEGPHPTAFLDGRSDGLIILAPHEDDTLPAALAQRGHPIVIIGGRPAPGERSRGIDTDHIRGGELAAEHLIGQGHRRIGMLLGPEGVPNAIDRKVGFERALRRNGLPIYPYWMVTSGFSRKGGYDAIHALWKNADRPAAICAANDVAAVGALEACAELSVRVPEDLAIIGYDDTPLCDLTRPPLTSVRQPAREMGKSSAEALLAIFSGEAPPNRVFEPEVIPRKSCGEV